jgi:carboxyl-terminal processing protease
MNNVLKTILTIICTAIVTALLVILVIYGGNKDSAFVSFFRGDETENVVGAGLETSTLSQKLKLIRNKINSEYIGTIDENQMAEYTIKGYVAGLGDKYSAYYTKEEMTDLMEDTKGNFVGIGVYLTLDEEKNLVKVYGVIPNSPAEEVGVQAGDYITNVNGINLDGSQLDKLADDLRGEEGTKVTFKVLRGSETLEFNATRRKVEIVHVSGQVVEGNIGYIAVDSYDGKVAEQFEAEYDKLASQGIKALIVDIRNNGGGLVDQSVTMADYFLDSGTGILIEKNNKDQETTTRAKTRKKITMPTVVLVNGYSASASEIFSAALKEKADNVTIVGTKTYGKGVIQGIYNLTDGSGLKLTIEEYFTPNHNSINNVGVEPDVVVDDYEYASKLDTENDTQYKKAIEILKEKIQ